jgi:two-component system KDP operon response regulator KdpE
MFISHFLHWGPWLLMVGHTGLTVTKGQRKQMASHSTCISEEKKGLRILLVDEQPSMLNGLGAALTSVGYHVYQAATCEDTLRQHQCARPEIVLLDPFLPNLDGKELLRRLRMRTSIPILILSSQCDEADIVGYLDGGADDYLTKPVTFGELIARIRVALRHAFGSSPDEIFRTGDLSMDFSRREVFIGQSEVRLSATEYHLLNVLVRHAGKVRTHRQLIHEVWGGTQYQDAVHLLRVTVSNLRRKLTIGSKTGLPILTEPGVGYRLRSTHSSAALTQ